MSSRTVLYAAIKLAFYFVSKWTGLFALARLLSGQGLQILCYHGFEISDECKFRPALFIKPGTFKQRLRYIKENGYNVLSLQKGCELLVERRLPKHAVVITIDDGFFSTLKYAQPLLLTYSLPATVYITSYYSLKQTPVFRLAVRYIFWKTIQEELDLSGLGPAALGTISTRDTNLKESAMWKLIRFGEYECDEPQRGALSRELGKRAGVDYGILERNRSLSFVNAQEISEMAAAGIDIQLQTHRHCLPNDRVSVHSEITENRKFLQPLTNAELSHLAYPSGIWSPELWPWLKEMGIKTGATCDLGRNTLETPLLGLRRFLDGENVRQIEFEAELSGFSEFLRRAVKHLSLLFTNSRTATPQEHHNISKD